MAAVIEEGFHTTGWGGVESPVQTLAEDSQEAETGIARSRGALPWQDLSSDCRG